MWVWRFSVAVSLQQPLAAIHPWYQTPQVAWAQMLLYYLCHSGSSPPPPTILTSHPASLFPLLHVHLCLLFRFQVACTLFLWVAGFPWNLSLQHGHDARLAASTPAYAFTTAGATTHPRPPAKCQQMQKSSTRLWSACILSWDAQLSDSQPHTLLSSSADLVIYLGILKKGNSCFAFVYFVLLLFLI